MRKINNFNYSNSKYKIYVFTILKNCYPRIILRANLFSFRFPQEFWDRGYTRRRVSPQGLLGAQNPKLN